MTGKETKAGYRRDWGFSLNEAAQIQQAVARRGLPCCPRCRGALAITAGGTPTEEVDLVVCPHCSASVTLRIPQPTLAIEGAFRP